MKASISNKQIQARLDTIIKATKRCEELEAKAEALHPSYRRSSRNAMDAKVKACQSALDSKVEKLLELIGLAGGVPFEHCDELKEMLTEEQCGYAWVLSDGAWC